MRLGVRVIDLDGAIEQADNLVAAHGVGNALCFDVELESIRVDFTDRVARNLQRRDADAPGHVVDNRVLHLDQAGYLIDIGFAPGNVAVAGVNQFE